MSSDGSTAAADAGAPTRRLVLVAGVGRSGTSLFTSILGQAGFHVPQPEVDADSTNPKGFGEPKWAVDFHGRQLRSRRVSVWDSRPSAWQDTSAGGRRPSCPRRAARLAEGAVRRPRLRRGQGPADRLVPPAVGEGRRGPRRRGVVRHAAAPPGGGREQRHQVVRRLADPREPDRVLAQHHARDRVRDPRPEADLRPVRRPAHRLVRPGRPDRATRSPSRRCRTSTPTSGRPSTRSSTRRCTARR